MGYTRSLDHLNAVARMVGKTVIDNGDKVWKEEELYNNKNGQRKVVKIRSRQSYSKVVSHSQGIPDESLDYFSYQR